MCEAPGSIPGISTFFSYRFFWRFSYWSTSESRPLLWLPYWSTQLSFSSDPIFPWSSWISIRATKCGIWWSLRIWSTSKIHLIFIWSSTDPHLFSFLKLKMESLYMDSSLIASASILMTRLWRQKKIKWWMKGCHCSIWSQKWTLYLRRKITYVLCTRHQQELEFFQLQVRHHFNHLLFSTLLFFRTLN